VESVFNIPAAMLHEVSQTLYEEGVAWVQNIAFFLGKAVAKYHGELGDLLDRAEARDRAKQIRGKAEFFYWTEIEGKLNLLLELVARPPTDGVQIEWQKTEWGSEAKQAAVRAYEFSCPHDTSRQIRAYALGLRELRNPTSNKEKTLNAKKQLIPQRREA
jgi:hypothetical protein